MLMKLLLKYSMRKRKKQLNVVVVPVIGEVLVARNQKCKRKLIRLFNKSNQNKIKIRFLGLNNKLGNAYNSKYHKNN